ncbi:Gfo/Idh/MocA family oxidoreductase, partial [Nocardia gipuzkoensis]
APLRSVEPEYAASPYPAYPGFMERFRSAYTEELAVFLSVIEGTLDNPCSPSDALEAFYIAEACELSRREHRPVPVDEVRV